MQNTSEPTPSQRPRYNMWRLLTLLIAGGLLTLTLITWRIVSHGVQMQNKQQFENVVKAKTSRMEKRFALYQQALLGGVGLLNGSQEITREEWRLYAQTLMVEENLPGTHGIGLIDYVQQHELPEYLERMRSDNAPDFVNHPQTNDADKFIIRYIEPTRLNAAAIGLDIGFEQNRRQAAEEARDTGQMRLTHKISLLQDEQSLPGFLLLAPAYFPTANGHDVTSRREHFRGWIYSPFTARRFLQDLHDIGGSQANFSVYDAAMPNPNELLYEWQEGSPPQPEFSQWSAQTQLHLAGRVWSIHWTPNAAFKPAASQSLAHIILAVGLLLSLICTGLFFLLSKLYGRSTRESQQQRQHLNESRHFLQIIMDNIPDYVFVKNKDFCIVQCNRAFFEMYPEQERPHIIGRTTVESFKPDEAALFLANDKTAFETGRHECKETLQMPDGQVRTLYTQKIRFYDGDGKAFILCIARDITEQEKIDVIKDEFISTVNHELRTPLTAILGSLELLKNRFPIADASDKVVKLLNLAHSNSQRLAVLINDILDIEKIAAGKMEYEFEPTNIHQLTTNIVEQNLSYAEKYQVQFKMHPPSAELWVSIDQSRYQQVITNLLSNAAKFSHQGGVIDIYTEAQSNGYVAIHIKDYGEGVPDFFHDHIFGKFSQADSSSTRGQEGSGLGLNICQSIVQAFDGKLTFDKTRTDGATFSVLLPCITPPQTTVLAKQ